MHWSLSSGISAAVVLAAAFTPTVAGAQGLGLEVDLDLVVEMPLAVAEALDAGVPSADLRTLTRYLVDGEVPPADFIEVVTLSPVVYEVDLVDRPDRDGRERIVYRGVDTRRTAAGPGLGAYVQRQLDRGLRGPDLARAIHRELNRRGIPAGPKDRRIGVRGGDRVALDLGELRELRERRIPPGRDDDRFERRDRPRGRDHTPPGQLKKQNRGKGAPPGHAKARGRGHDKGHGKGPPPHDRGGRGQSGKGGGHGNGGGR